MNLFKRIIEIIDFNIIFCLIPIILTLIIVEGVFRKRFETKKVLNVITKIIIIYTLITMIYSLIGVIFYPEEFEFIKRATGPYSWAYWVMFLSASILPLTLLNKKIANNFFYVLFVSIFMKIGYYFERFVIIVTSFHRDYQTENKNTEFMESYSFVVLTLFLQGIVLAFISLGIFEMTKKIKIKVS